MLSKEEFNSVFVQCAEKCLADYQTRFSEKISAKVGTSNQVDAGKLALDLHNESIAYTTALLKTVLTALLTDS